MLKKSPVFFGVIFALSVAPINMTLAMNWEGHDDWMENSAHAQVLKSILPSPKKTEIPQCEVRVRSGQDNPYERRPVPGLNCHDPAAPAQTYGK